MKKQFKNFLYGAYGSNLNVAQMRVRCPDAVRVGTHTLEGWRLVFRHVADIVPDESSSVELGLWRITGKCLTALDRYEGFPHLYIRQVFAGSGIMVYRMTEPYPISPPSNGYLQTINQGYADFGIESDKLIAPLKHSYVKESVISSF